MAFPALGCQRSSFRYRRTRVIMLWQWGENRREGWQLAMIAGFFIVLCLAGGSSRADVLGQVVSRTAAWVLVIVAIIQGAAFTGWRSTPALIGWSLLAGLIILQLIPFPPSIWLAFPGRNIPAETAIAMAETQPWRPLSLSPSATTNSLGALIVPLAIILTAKDFTPTAHRTLAFMMLLLALAGCFLGLTQIVGAAGDNPLINDVRGMIGGNFANRNHFAAFLAVAMLILGLIVATANRARSKFTVYAALAISPLLVLMVIATGSRMGLLVLTISVILTGALAWTRLMLLLPRKRSWKAYALIALPALLIASAIAASVVFGRAASFDRAAEMNISDDFRAQVLPLLIDMAAHYFPVGSGFGTFDPVFRIWEPDRLLRAAYFNHAHNDWLEFLIEGGALSVALGLAGFWWWGRHFWAAWSQGSRENALARCGTAIVLLCLVASFSDYPLRTPTMMVVAAIAILWSSTYGSCTSSPDNTRHLRDARGC